MNPHFEKHIPVEQAELTAIDCLANNTEFSKQTIKKIMQNGAVWLESESGISRLRRAKKKLKPNDTLHFYYDEGIQSTVPSEAILIADENDYSIWDKPYGMYSQGTKWGDHCSIYRWAEKHLSPERPAFLVHRLDKAASGLIIIAHKKSIAREFSEMFKQHAIIKKYHATAEGIIDLDHLPFIIDTPLDDKEAISEILSTSINMDNNTTHIEISIKTGRKHQIRQHLAGLDHAIVGDRLYGNKLSPEKGKQNCDINLQLRSSYLEFNCPVTQLLKCYNVK